MRFLNTLYARFDALLENYNVFKVETIGDCYVAAAGIGLRSFARGANHSTCSVSPRNALLKSTLPNTYQFIDVFQATPKSTLLTFEARKTIATVSSEEILKFAKCMLQAAREVKLPGRDEGVNLRIGLHSGPVVSGVVGRCMPRFCLFGRTV